MPLKAKFIPPMRLLKTDSLPVGERWSYELKLDGYRGVTFKSGGRIHLRSRNDKDVAARYPSLMQGLAGWPDEA
jgi:bifunctional non-homologous end joining protein LigD